MPSLAACIACLVASVVAWQPIGAAQAGRVLGCAAIYFFAFFKRLICAVDVAAAAARPGCRCRLLPWHLVTLRPGGDEGGWSDRCSYPLYN